MNFKKLSKPQQYLNLYFQVHQPRRLRKFQFFDIGSHTSYFDDAQNKSILTRIAGNCYLPTNKMLLRLIKKYPQVRVTFSISGVALEQLHNYAPEVLDSFRELASSGAVEFLGETFYHSLSFLRKEELERQVKQHRQKMIDLLGIRPVIFRNTELIYSDQIAQTVFDLGFKGMYLDGVDAVLQGRTANKIYRHPEEDLLLFPRNYKLSDDIAFRYSERNWNQWPLTSQKFVSWLKKIPSHHNLVTLGIDYETFGEHQKAEGGIFQFLEGVISCVAKLNRLKFINPSEARKILSPDAILSTNKIISWADEARDLSAWLGNDLQRDAFDTLNKFHFAIIHSGDSELINDYRYLQTSDHFYYMSTTNTADGNIHQYFSPYSSPYEAFMNYMNVLADLELRVKKVKHKLKSGLVHELDAASSGRMKMKVPSTIAY